MKKKITKVIGIIIIILFIIGLVTSYKDSARVRAMIEPKYTIKIVNESGNKVTYWGLGYKVIRYVGVSPNEPFKNNVGLKYGNWFMKYEFEEKGKNTTDDSEIVRYEKEIDNITLKLDIPEDWKCEELPQNEENNFYKFALKIYKTDEEQYAVLYYYHQMFGVCGTGRTSDQIVLNNGTKAIIGYYDGKDTWEDISFYEMNEYIAVLNNGLNMEESNEFIGVIKTLNIVNMIDKNDG